MLVLLTSTSEWPIMYNLTRRHRNGLISLCSTVSSDENTEIEERMSCSRSHSESVAELAGDKPQGFWSPWPASTVHSLARSSSANPAFITIQ